MEMPSNPLAVLTFISAPAVLTNASCVLLFGTGNRYGRAVDRLHELAEMVLGQTPKDMDELALRIRQLEAAEGRTTWIVRALTCFYLAVAGFVAATLISLVGAVAMSMPFHTVLFALAFVCGAVGVCAMITGATFLVRESRWSLAVLKKENVFLAHRVKALREN